MKRKREAVAVGNRLSTQVTSSATYWRRRRTPRPTTLNPVSISTIDAGSGATETGHQLLMRGHFSAGNAAEALLAYERCRKHLSEELGVDPSRQTRAIHDEVLRSL